MDSSAKARYIIKNNQLATVATADENGKPWVSPLGCVLDDNFNLYWVSHNYAIHSKNIKKRPQVAIVIVGSNPDGKTDGVYFEAEAKELEDKEEIKFAINILKQREQDEKFKIKSINDVIGDAVWRIYKAKPIKVYKRADQTLKGQAITVRDPIEL